MRKIGIDRRDPSYRHFYYDDSVILNSNPPKYKVWYVDDENDIDYVDCNQVIFIKKSPVNNEKNNNENSIILDENEISKKIVMVEDEVQESSIKVDGDVDSIDNLVVKTEPKKRGRKKKEVESKIETKETKKNIISRECLNEEKSIKELDDIKFEYKIFDIDFSSSNELSDLLNEYGNECWELCGCELYNGGLIFDKKKIFCIMKRKKSGK